MSAVDPPSESRLDGLLRLTTELADRVLDDRIMKRPVREDQVRALASAAQLLRDHGVEWPPLLTQALHEMTQENGEAEGAPRTAGLKRLLGAFRKERGEA